MAKTIEVPIKGEAGEDLGFAIRLGPAIEPVEDDPTGVKTLAARIEGWTAHQLHGEPHAYSKARALAFLVRYPHIAAQLRKAAPAKDDAK